EAEAAPRLDRIEEAIGVLAGKLLAFEELGDLLDFLPSGWHAPFALMAFGLPRRPEIRVGEIVGAVVEIVAVAVDADAIGLALPVASRRFQIADIVVHLDLRLHPVGHLGAETLATDIALERRAHLDDVEIDGAGGDGLLQTRAVVGLRQI